MVKLWNVEGKARNIVQWCLLEIWKSTTAYDWGAKVFFSFSIKMPRYSSTGYLLRISCLFLAKSLRILKWVDIMAPPLAATPSKVQLAQEIWNGDVLHTSVGLPPFVFASADYLGGELGSLRRGSGALGEKKDAMEMPASRQISVCGSRVSATSTKLVAQNGARQYNVCCGTLQSWGLHSLTNILCDELRRQSAKVILFKPRDALPKDHADLFHR